MSVDHYENFPVASILLPKALRPAVTDIYRFARTADDIADEGLSSDQERITALHNYKLSLDNLALSQALPESLQHLNFVFAPLASSIQRHELSYQPFYDLLLAFEQDISVKRYHNMDDVRDYCTRSADPVGRLMLALFKADTPQNISWSDAICTALQLINFWQDVAIDWQKDRVYIPQELLLKHQLNDKAIAEYCSGKRLASTDTNWQELMGQLHFSTKQLLLSGTPLIQQLPLRFALELKFIILGGLRILERLKAVKFDVFQHRPTLAKTDWALLCLRSLKPIAKHQTL